VGFIALAGVAAETGIVMLIYLNQALDEIKARRKVEGRALTRSDLYDAIMEGAVERVRPKMMTVMAIMVGLLPIMWSTGTRAAHRGADDRRHDLLDAADVDRDPGNLRLGKGLPIAERRPPRRRDSRAFGKRLDRAAVESPATRGMRSGRGPYCFYAHLMFRNSPAPA